MYDFLKDPQFLENRKNKNHHFFGNVGLESPTWDDVLSLVSIDAKQNPKFKISHDYMVAIDSGQHLKYVGKFLKEYAKVDLSKQATSHIYISLLNIGAYGRHKDRADVLFWQILGSTHWLVEDTQKSEYILKPGDAIYIPIGMYHTVHSLSPRVGVSFGLDY